MKTAVPKPRLVSIVVASYNHAEYLEQRMESLINQTYQNIEIIVIDDCSPDNSVEVLKKYDSHPKVNLIIREENGGWVAVSNQGAKMAKGEFIIFANCDDYCDHTLIEQLVSALDKYNSAGIAFSRSLMINEKNVVLGDDYASRTLAFKRKCKQDVLLSTQEMQRFLMHSCVIPNLSAALFRKQCLIDSGYFSPEYKVCCDWQLFFKVAKKLDVAYVAKPLNKFRQHSTTIRSSIKQRDIYAEFFNLLLSQIELLKLGFYERCIIRVRAMDLWVRYLLLNPASGLANLKYHMKLISKLDVTAMLFLPIALLSIFMTTLRKVLNK
jgi:glycosyltransferase involved in cell wall biosynthesis